MTDEQIRQNAEEYTCKLQENKSRIKSILPTIQEIYIAGAHSRDVEIEQLEFDKYLNTKRIKVQEEIISELRNPWISVDEHLPEEDPDNKGYSVEVIGFFPDGSVSECSCSIEENIWFFKGLTCDKPTHWMPKPKL